MDNEVDNELKKYLRTEEDVEEVPAHCRASDMLYQFYEDQYYLKDKKGNKTERLKILDLLCKKIHELHSEFMDEESIYRKVSIRDRLVAFNHTLLGFEVGNCHVYVTISKAADYKLKQLSRMFHSSDDNILRIAIFDTLKPEFKAEDDIIYKNLLFRRELIAQQMEMTKHYIKQFYEMVETNYEGD